MKKRIHWLNDKNSTKHTLCGRYIHNYWFYNKSGRFQHLTTDQVEDVTCAICKQKLLEIDRKMIIKELGFDTSKNNKNGQLCY